ncbi:MAG: RidA family protein [Candidatus Levybacteria bacterium]|nr:RidA family protein [Candidatus Levybacteria bacterium]
MKRIQTNQAPQAIGPYSQAIVANGFVFCSGQIGLTPDGTFAGDDVTAQTHQVIQNLKAVLEASGSSLENVVKTTCYLTNIAEFQTFNAVYETYFGNTKPARGTVGVNQLPKDAKVEIEVIALAS